jgi:transposase
MAAEWVTPTTLDEAVVLLRALWEENVALRVENAALRERVVDLEARVAQDSTNSSRPPSSDPPATPAPPPRPPTGRKRGAQPGHPPARRQLLPPEAVDHVVRHWPARCQHCQAALTDGPREVVGAPVRHQVTELPPVRAEVTEHQLSRVRCRRCGGETRASLPPDVPAGAFGPRLQAAVALLSGRYRLSRREVAAVCDDLLGARLAVGSVDALCQATAAALAEPVAELAAAAREEPAVHADETGWAQAGRRQWLWVVTTALITVFTIAASRGRGVIQGLLGEDFGGRLVSDRWSAYTWLPLEQRQVCWAHLRRDFLALLNHGPSAAQLGLALLAVTDRVFDAWHQARGDPAARPWLRETITPLQAEMRALLEAGQALHAAKAAGLSRSLLQIWPALWTFVEIPGVEPTNNAAERALRPAVLWRKGSFGTQSDAGNLFVARLLSVAATCRQQQRPLLAYLTDVCTAAQLGLPSPSLLPPPPLARAP